MNDEGLKWAADLIAENAKLKAELQKERNEHIKDMALCQQRFEHLQRSTDARRDFLMREIQKLREKLVYK